MVFRKNKNVRYFYEKMKGILLDEEKYFEKEGKNIKRQDIFIIFKK